MSVPFVSNEIVFLESYLKMPLMILPVRSTYIQIASSGILVSPGSQLNETQLRSLPPVTDIIAPNLFHCDGITKAMAQFPKAKCWGPLTCFEKKPQFPKEPKPT